jgi:hypothetical protein
MVESGAVELLAPLARQAMSGAAYDKLVVRAGTPEEAKKLLGSVRAEQLLAVPIKSHDAASAMLAGLWLWHDSLEESHNISQSLHTVTGSFWHAHLH